MENNNWPETTLRNLVDIKHGFAFQGEYFTNEEMQDVLLTPGNFAIGGGYKDDKLKYYFGEVPEDYVLARHDLIVTMTDLSKEMDTLGYSALVPEKAGKRFLHNQRLGKVLIRDEKQIDKYFLFYLLRTEDYRNEVRASASGSVIRHTSPDRIRNYKFFLPPLSEQRAIAGILGALDDKIEVNRRMNATLESMARTVFRQWFVRNVDVDNWEVKTLGKVLVVLETGSRPKGGVSQEPLGLPSVGAESIIKLGYFDFSKTKYVPSEFYKSMRRGHIEDRDVLLYKDGGRPGEFEPHVTMFGDNFPFEKFSINEHVYRMRISAPFSQVFLYFWLESNEIMDEMRNRGTGVAIPGLNSTALSGISISIPPEKWLNDFSNYVEPLVSKIFSNAKESRTLASLRDSLLPKLMRGEVRVKA